MLTCDLQEAWALFLECAQKRCSASAYANWLATITIKEATQDEFILEIPNIYVEEYLLSNFKKELCAFLPVRPNGEPAITFQIAAPKKTESVRSAPLESTVDSEAQIPHTRRLRLNSNYRFDNFIVGPENSFVRNAAFGVAEKPGKSYNPLFIHGAVGLGKTHILHSIGHHIRETNRHLRVQCITTEAFINEIVDSLRKKKIDEMKDFYRNVDVLLVDDIQFLQNRLNFEEEFCNTFEALINQGKQIVIASDKQPAQLKLSERLIARMEWGLVAHMGIPELETRVAILQHKAQQKGLNLSSDVAFFIAEHIFNNVRQLEGALNRLSATSRLMDLQITKDLVQNTLQEMFQQAPRQKISVEEVLKSVAAVFDVRVSDLRGTCRTNKVALPRQVAMYLACKLINESLQMLGASFGKTHSTLLHACKSIEKKAAADEMLARKISMVEGKLTSI